jgi:hypothetical protein
MKRLPILILILILIQCTLSSCSSDEHSLGDSLILYKGDEKKSFGIGLDHGDGGIQELIYGEIDSYGYNHTFVVARMKDDSHYFFKKSDVKFSAKPTKSVKGPLDLMEFKKISDEMHFPPLIYSTP